VRAFLPTLDAVDDLVDEDEEDEEEEEEDDDDESLTGLYITIHCLIASGGDSDAAARLLLPYALEKNPKYFLFKQLQSLSLLRLLNLATVCIV
jgi:hypothetical protein